MNKYRTHTCSELTIDSSGKDVVLSGWINKKRDHGNLLFIDLRDNYGMTQCIIDKSNENFNSLEKIQLESVIKINGRVVERTKETINNDLQTGEIEVNINSFEVLGTCKELPMPVFSDQEYFKELNTQLQRHFDNSARFSYSVAESSFDTWLDGYEPGAPGRKVSIYTEGCLLAFVTDVLIMKGSANKSTLDAVMRQLYFDYALEGKGVSEEDYKKSIENFAGVSMDELFQDFIHGTKPFESIIVSALDYLGLELDHEPSPIYSEAKLGFRTVVDNGKVIVKAMYPGSPAEVGNVMLEDEIIALNGVRVNNDLEFTWMKLGRPESVDILISRGGLIRPLTGNFKGFNEIEYSITLNANQKTNDYWLTEGAVQKWLKVTK